jgi:hypothetical protein
MAYAFENVFRQYEDRKKRIIFWNSCKENLDTAHDSMVQVLQKLKRQAESLCLVDEQNILDHEFPMKPITEEGRQNGESDPVIEWGIRVTNSLESAYQDRVAVMTDFKHGIIEFSKVLVTHEVPHVIVQIEKYVSVQTGGQKQMQLCGNGFKGEKTANNQTFKDEGIIEYVNNYREEVPVILFNSYVPEGVSLLHTRHLHVLPMSETYTNISQMIGRINRLCNTTQQDKMLYMYVYKGSTEESNYNSELNSRLTWPHANPTDTETN